MTDRAIGEHEDENKSINEFKTEMMIPQIGGYLDDYAWLIKIAQVAKQSPRQYILFALFTSICEGCYSGALISMIKKLQSKGGNELEIYSFVSREYSEYDIIGLTTQLSITFPVEIADSSLSQEWDKLINEYGRNSTNGIIFVSDRNARIVDILTRTQSLEQFYHRCFLRSMEKYEEQATY